MFSLSQVVLSQPVQFFAHSFLVAIHVVFSIAGDTWGWSGLSSPALLKATHPTQ